MKTLNLVNLFRIKIKKILVKAQLFKTIKFTNKNLNFKFSVKISKNLKLKIAFAFSKFWMNQNKILFKETILKNN